MTTYRLTFSKMHVEIEEVKYRAEGNQNIVVGLNGTNKVLRLRKSKDEEKGQLKKLEAIQSYINQVIQPVLGEYVSKVFVVHLQNDQLEYIKKTIALSRPEERLSKNLFTPVGLLMTDHCLPQEPGSGPTLAVEIKPKMGFIHEKYFKDTWCKFCTKKISDCSGDKKCTKSRYCPLELFSGDDYRMVKAIENLMITPRNNLRIFKDGSLLHDEKSTNNTQCQNFLSSTFGDPSIFPQVLVSLLKSNCNDIQLSLKKKTEIDDTRDPESCNRQSQPLPEKCILESILSLQRNDMTDEDAQYLLNSLLSAGIDLKTLQDFIHGGSVESEKITEEIGKKLQKLKRFAMSVTARDLSLIVTITPEAIKDVNKGGSWIVINGKLFKYQLAIVDLDPKDLGKINTYVETRKKRKEIIHG